VRKKKKHTSDRRKVATKQSVAKISFFYENCFWRNQSLAPTVEKLEKHLSACKTETDITREIYAKLGKIPFG